MLMSQSLRRIARSYPNRTAIVEGDLRRDWRDFEDRIARLAGALAEIGLGKGDRVAILSGNSSRFAEFYYAIFWIGAVAVPLNARLSVRELIQTLADSEPCALFIERAFLPQLDALQAGYDGLKHIVLTTPDDGTAPPGLLHHDALIATGRRIDPASGPDDTLASLCYTSGTTGVAKGVMLSHAALWATAAAQVIDYPAMTDGVTTFIHCLPLFHTGGSSGLFAVTMAGGTHVFLPSLTPTSFLEATQAARATHTMMVPTLLRMVLDEPDIGAFDLSSLKLVMCGGAPLPEEHIRAATVHLPDAAVLQAYGQTELAPFIACVKSGEIDLDGATAHRLKSVGRAGFNVEVIVADSDGRELPRGTVGEVLVRGPNMMTGYWRKPDETATTMGSGWVRTGDGGYMDTDGFIYLVDRLKDMIVTGGENVYSSEVENAVASHPAVAGCAVFGIPDDKWGEAVHAVVMLRPDAAASEADIIAHVRTQIAGYKCPRTVAFRTDPFPLIGLGKISKRALRDEYLAHGNAVPG
jgi:long-chain acyl-CoA synthetase